MKKSKPQKNSKINNKPTTTLSDFFKKIEDKKKLVASDVKQSTSKEQDENQCEIQSPKPNSPKKRKTQETYSTNVESKSSKRICLSQISSTSNSSSPTLSFPKKAANTTPEKSKKSTTKTSRTPPLKLFQRTPTKVSDFSVNILENFVKITPSKSGNKSPSSSGKIRTTPIKHCSPSISNRSIEAQRFNEMTPKKETPSKNAILSPTSKVKARLDFGVSKSPPFISKIKDSQGTSQETGISVENEIKDILSENSINDCFSDLFDNEFEEESLVDDAGSVAHESTLDLNESKYCKVIKIEFFPSYNKITIKSNSTEEYAVCLLRDFWFNTNLEIGDKIHIMAKKKDSEWVVDNQSGLIVYEPDLLISSTSVVNTLFCKRRSVLSDKYQGFEPANEFMLVGTLVHSILQETLKLKLNSISQIEGILEKILATKDSVRRIYESGETIESVKTKMAIYIPRILEFVDSYVRGKKELNKKCWQGKIDEVEDIEENLWCHGLGIKGKVDVTIKHGLRVMPLELKTGKASFSLEHKGQILLYIMMMNKLGYKVSSGLLLYLKDGIIKEIPMSENEKRDIIMLRNELAFYLRRKPKLIKTKLKEKAQKIEPPDLPNAINHHSACGKCPYNIICTTFLEYNKDDLSSNKSLRDVKDEVLAHLSEEHINYFILWSSLINLEEVSGKTSSKSVQEILSVAAPQRESKGRCICDLKISEISDELNGIMNHTFIKDGESNFNFFASGIEEGNYCVISTDNRPAVLTGFVTFIDAHSITVALDKNLKVKYSGQRFHIDTYESSHSHAFNRTCLTLLLEPSNRAEHLRSVVIDKKSPSFSNKLPKVVAVKGMKILKRLNAIQRKAVLKAVSANDYLLIKGMPGTGKSATIVALVELLSILGKTVLITSHTHNAVDNICVKLCKLGVDFMRLGSQSRIHSSLEKYSEHYKTKDCTTPEQLAEVYDSTKIIAVTCLGSGHPILSKRTMDVCIVDESTQVVQSTVIRPLHAAKVFVLVGDPEQLPPVVRSPEAVDLGMAKSLFERLDSEESRISLTLNYRMNEVITKLANDLTYGGNLLVANDETGKATLTIPNEKEMWKTFDNSDWMKKIFDTRLEHSVKFIDTGPVWKRKDTISWNVKDESNRENKSVVNVHEAAIIYNLTHSLLMGGVKPEDIGVIATYNYQVKQLSCILNEHIDVSTVDSFQGKDKDVILYSCTKSVEPSEKIAASKFEILEDHRRLNVAVTRAKHKLILVGDVDTVKRYAPFAKLLGRFEESNIIRLEENKSSFQWSRVLNNVKQLCQ